MCTEVILSQIFISASEFVQKIGRELPNTNIENYRPGTHSPFEFYLLYYNILHIFPVGRLCQVKSIETLVLMMIDNEKQHSLSEVRSRHDEMNISWLLFLLVCFRCTSTAKILGFFEFPAISHQSIFQPIWRELSLRGHEVTVITPNPLNDPTLTNLTEIDIGFLYDVLSKVDFPGNVGKDKSALQIYKYCHELSRMMIEKVVESESVGKLLERDDNYFDLVIVQSLDPSIYIFSGKFKAPVVGITSFEPITNFQDAAGNPTHPIISPDNYLRFEGQLTFMQKLQSVLFNITYRLFYYWHFLPESDKLVRKYFGNDIPYLGDVISNTSLFLVNVNPILSKARANVPTVIEINQMHIKEKKPLPKDILDYLESSTQGLVYFSLGSNVKSSSLNAKTRKTIIQALSELPFNVLWKWETDDLPNRPKNVITRKWLPQQDILGHPNVKVFVTQGGLQSLEETINNEVPIVGLPFITDQTVNIAKMAELGMGLGLDHETLTKDGLKDAIIEVATNGSYKQEVQKAKSILVDQPMIGVEKAVWWIEYVIRHKGARHLRSAAADMTFFEYFMVDVLVFLLLCIYISVKIFVFCLKSFVNILQSRRRSKIKLN